MGDSNETSGSYPVHKNEGVLTVNVRTIVVALVALFGGAAGGGGLAFVRPSVTPDAIETLTSEVKDVSRQLSDIKIKLERMDERSSKSDAIDLDHEARIRKLEEYTRVPH